MEGLIIKFEGRTRNIVKELLKGIDFSKFDFDISHWESYGDDIESSQFDFNKSQYLSSQLIKSKIIEEDNYVCPEFLELFIRKVESAGREIYYYKDFVESDYIISIINYDYRNLEICCKDDKIIGKIKNNFMNLNLQNKRVKEINNISLDSILQAWRKGKGIDE